MSFAVRSSIAPRNFSSSSASGTAMQRGTRSSAGSMFGGAGGVGSRISAANIRGLANALRPHVQLNNGFPLPAADDKETMKGLNDRLAGYLSKVRLLEESNSKLEDQIKEVLMAKGNAKDRDWSAYENPLAELRQQVRDMTMGNARLMLQIDNGRLAADDFKVKFETEQAMRQGVEQDIAGLRKLLDDTYMGRMQLESQIESLREELVYLKQNHEEDVGNLRGQINDSSVKVEMEVPKGADLSETINKIRKQYDKAAQKNREDTEAWYKSKFDNISSEVTQNTEALQTGKSELNDLRRQKQALEIDLQALHNMNRNLEDTLGDTESRYAQDMNRHNQRLLQLEGELGQVRAQVERQAADYQALLNVKMKLEAEIATYHRLLGGSDEDDDRVDFSLEQALNAAPPPQAVKRVLILNQEVVDGEVVSQSELEMSPSNDTQREEEVIAPEEEVPTESAAEVVGEEEETLENQPEAEAPDSPAMEEEADQDE